MAGKHSYEELFDFGGGGGGGYKPNIFLTNLLLGLRACAVNRLGKTIARSIDNIPYGPYELELALLSFVMPGLIRR